MARGDLFKSKDIQRGGRREGRRLRIRDEIEKKGVNLK